MNTAISTNHDTCSMQAALDRLQQWCCDWQLTINVGKCHILHLGIKNTRKTYILNGNKVSSAHLVGDLGVDVDEGMTYDAHINKIIGKAYSRIGVLLKGFASRNVRVLKKAYLTYIRPVLEYASSVWSPHLLKHINAIERVQKYFTRCVPCISHLSYPERLAAIDLEPLELRRLKNDLVLYFKSYHDLVALPFNDYFVQSLNVTQTRTGGNRLLRPMCRTNRFENDFFNRSISCFNSLPSDAVNANSIYAFKHFLSSCDLSHFIHCSYL